MKRLLTFLLMLLVFSANASDLAKEQRWAEQVVGDLFDGEPIALNADNTKFLGLLTEAETPKPLAILVLHGIGAHPDWPQVVNPLRVQLAELGWTTLSLQMPILDNEASSDDYQPLMAEVAPRINAGIAHLQQRGFSTVAIVAHSMGSHMSSYYLADSAASDAIVAFAGVGMGKGNLNYLDAIQLPILDLYGEKDLPDVVDLADQRRQAAANNSTYTQQMVPDADHFFDGFEASLLNAVSAWLKDK